MLMKWIETTKWWTSGYYSDVHPVIFINCNKYLISSSFAIPLMYNYQYTTIRIINETVCVQASRLNLISVLFMVCIAII